MSYYAAAQSNNNNTPLSNNVLEAIDIYREKLKVDPHIPRIQHSLAQLLDSQISADDSYDIDTTLITEVLQLYHEVGQPSSQVEEEKLLTAKERFESLTRAGTIARDILHDIPKAVKHYSLAMNLEGVDETTLLREFETIMPGMISLIMINVENQNLVKGVEISSHGTLLNTASADEQLTQSLLDMCNIVEEKCPTATVVDEYRGAILRKANNIEQAYQSYDKARKKAKKNLFLGKGTTKSHVELVSDFVRTSILSAASARETGRSFDQQMAALSGAEEVAAPLLLSVYENEDMEEHDKDSFRNLLVDLYNNMGIAEKKHGSYNKARDFFSKALEINPKDGHSLVQFASVDDGTNSDIVSNVKELDPDYVTALFDGYSTKFEHELVDNLEYKGHLLLYDEFEKTVNQLGQSPLSMKKVVDLGCGTGLLGEVIANEMPWVEVLGVDLSQRMVDIARSRESKRGRKVYASVTNEDAAKYLATLQERSVDCILSSDVFIYIGDMSKVLEEGFKCLGHKGLFGFTVESYEGGSDPESGVRLLPIGRFGHSKAYITEVAKSKGFEVVSWEDIVIRQQRGKDVDGAAVILRKLN